MMQRIAIVGMACLYPDANSPAELWANVLAQRRSFRRIPQGRLCLEDYFSVDRAAPDCTYSTQAALIRDYDFDRSHFHVAGNTFRSTDLTHWVALDVAEKALKDAGLLGEKYFRRESTGVIVGNTLTGDLSRANSLRLRWPYVKRIVEKELTARAWQTSERRAFLEELEIRYKEPFTRVGEDTLAGGLANTIAGRICNYFDLGGGGYTVDGACCSSLLAVAQGCRALAVGEIDVAVVGGVDLSIDPFELIGFAKTGALATDDMRVYDARADGFWPGEGCGFVVLMRHEDAVALDLTVGALISGWGISSDGSGGLTRPRVEGQRLALSRAYKLAAFGIETVQLFEGHGTATSVGDAVELQTLTAALEASGSTKEVAIGSIKGNIGHTKAAAGIAGLIKATLAIQNQILPPTAGFLIPAAELRGTSSKLRVLTEAEIWPAERPLRAGVSSMGFGGINAHVVIEGVASERRLALSAREIEVALSPQDTEAFFFGAKNAQELLELADRIRGFASQLSMGELSDLAVHLANTIGAFDVRAAIIASKPSDLATSLSELSSWVRRGTKNRLDLSAGIFLGSGCRAPRVAFLFPGQGGSLPTADCALRRRFQLVRDLYATVPQWAEDKALFAASVQSSIVASSIAAMSVLNALDIHASTALGHSLGELTALHWAGAIDQASLSRIAVARGNAMADFCKTPGAMASVRASRNEVEKCLHGLGIAIACINGPEQIVFSGEVQAVERAVARSKEQGWQCVRLPVTHAFHSSMMAPAVPPFSEVLGREDFQPLKRCVISTVSGTLLDSNEDTRELLCRQLTAPVLFEQALSLAAIRADLLIEVGPGEVLSDLARGTLRQPVVAMDAGSASLAGLLRVAAVAFALGVPVGLKHLFAGREGRPFALDWNAKFFTSPCELVSATDQVGRIKTDVVSAFGNKSRASGEVGIEYRGSPPNGDTLGVVKKIVAEFTELHVSAILDESRFLDDLHLNSITVAQIIARVARHLGLPVPAEGTEYANATIGQVAEAIDMLRSLGGPGEKVLHDKEVLGVGDWIRQFVVDLVESPLRKIQTIPLSGRSHVIAAAGHPLAAALRQRISTNSQAGGTIFCLLSGPDELMDGNLDLLLEAARMVIERKSPTRFVLVQNGWSAASFARCLHLEMPGIVTCVVSIPFEHATAVDWILADAFSAVDYSEAHYDCKGRRWEPRLRAHPIGSENVQLPLGPSDVLVISGGGKGIAAECALALSRQTGVRLGLLGRSLPGSDPELAATLERLRLAGVDFRYFSVDVTNQHNVRETLTSVRELLGPITGVIHGAGSNTPRALTDLDKTTFCRTIATKVHGLRNLLAVVDPSELRLLVSFGSLIARTGMRGEADYALANEWLTALTMRWQAENPHCRCLAVEWSVWSGVGMAERMGRLEALARQGINAITPERGVLALLHLLKQGVQPAPVIVTSRFGESKTLKIDRERLPLLRFLEHPRVIYPGVELVIDSTLTLDTDPYLSDHVFEGSRLLPAAMGLEAMAQAATGLVNATRLPIFENVRFSRPIVTEDRTPLTLRVAALVQNSGCVDVVLRSSETDFQIDHFSGTCRFEDVELPTSGALFDREQDPPCISISPKRELYGRLLFQSGRFCRVKGYRRLAAKGCIAEISPAEDAGVATRYFGSYMPETFILGDPSIRDAVMHCVQVCVPDSTMLPVEIGQILIFRKGSACVRVVHAIEQSRENEIFTYTINVTDPDGELLEQWRNVKFRAMRRPQNGRAGAIGADWSEALLGPYIERVVEDLFPQSDLSVVVCRDTGIERPQRSDLAIQRAVGRTVPITRRADGKPEISGDREVSVSHSGQVTMAVAGSGIVGCDMEPVIGRPSEIWHDLLGGQRFALAKRVAAEVREKLDVSATRLWTAGECLKKSGAWTSSPLTLASTGPEGWAVFSGESVAIATLVATAADKQSEIAFSVLVENQNGHL